MKTFIVGVLLFNLKKNFAESPSMVNLMLKKKKNLEDQ